MKIRDLLRRVFFLLRQRIYIHIDSLGIEFYHRGDQVIWVWPWARDGKDKWASLSFLCFFSSLAEIDEMWESYFQALRKVPPEPWDLGIPELDAMDEEIFH